MKYFIFTELKPQTIESLSFERLPCPLTSKNFRKKFFHFYPKDGVKGGFYLYVPPNGKKIMYLALGTALTEPPSALQALAQEGQLHQLIFSPQDLAFMHGFIQYVLKNNPEFADQPKFKVPRSKRLTQAFYSGMDYADSHSFWGETNDR